MENTGFETNDIDLNYGYLLEIGNDKEVIGNIFDNSELLNLSEVPNNSKERIKRKRLKL